MIRKLIFILSFSSLLLTACSSKSNENSVASGAASQDSAMVSVETEANSSNGEINSQVGISEATMETTEAYVAPSIADYSKAAMSDKELFLEEYEDFKIALEHYREEYPDEIDFIALCDSLVIDIQTVEDDPELEFNQEDLDGYRELFKEFKTRMGG